MLIDLYLAGESESRFYYPLLILIRLSSFCNFAFSILMLTYLAEEILELTLEVLLLLVLAERPSSYFFFVKRSSKSDS